ncbi:MAPEG family protein [Astrocystis sublimbata]|nr:MAPEG family protein [Astrocystis sublimbata]
MSLVFEVPKEYGYILAIATSTLFINTYHKLTVSIARGKAGIAYPTPYATAEQAAKDPACMKFNLTQRAHGNFGENLAPFLTSLLVAGLGYPTQAFYAGTAWVVGRAAYAYAYPNFGPKGRLPGYVVSQAGKAALTIMSVMTVWGMVQSA